MRLAGLPGGSRHDNPIIVHLVLTVESEREVCVQDAVQVALFVPVGGACQTARVASVIAAFLAGGKCGAYSGQTCTTFLHGSSWLTIQKDEILISNMKGLIKQTYHQMRNKEGGENGTTTGSASKLNSLHYLLKHNPT